MKKWVEENKKPDGLITISIGTVWKSTPHDSRMQLHTEECKAHITNLQEEFLVNLRLIKMRHLSTYQTETQRILKQTMKSS
jgi:hypothetical protein